MSVVSLGKKITYPPPLPQNNVKMSRAAPTQFSRAHVEEKWRKMKEIECFLRDNKHEPAQCEWYDCYFCAYLECPRSDYTHRNSGGCESCNKK